MTPKEAEQALAFIKTERIAFNALLETVRRSPKNMRGVVKIFLRGCGANDKNIDEAVKAFYTLAERAGK